MYLCIEQLKKGDIMTVNNIIAKNNSLLATSNRDKNANFCKDNVNKTVMVDGVTATIGVNHGVYALYVGGNHKCDLNFLTSDINKVGLTASVNDYLSFIGKRFRDL